MGQIQRQEESKNIKGLLCPFKSNDAKVLPETSLYLYACNKDRILDSLENEIDAKKCYEAIFTYCKSMKSIEFLHPKKAKQGESQISKSLASAVDLSSDFHFHTLKPTQSNITSIMVLS